MSDIASGKPLWVLRATQQGKMVRATKGCLIDVLPVLQKADEPMTAAEIAKAMGWAGDDLPVRKALGIIHGYGMLKSNRVPSRGHPFARMECEYELIDMDTLIDKE